MAPPAAPESGFSKRTFVCFYQANQDSALVSFLQQQPQQSNNGSATGQHHIRRHAVEVEADEPPDESGADSPGQQDLVSVACYFHCYIADMTARMWICH